jgi:hypothetical protein
VYHLPAGACRSRHALCPGLSPATGRAEMCNASDRATAYAMPVLHQQLIQVAQMHKLDKVCACSPFRPVPYYCAGRSVQCIRPSHCICHYNSIQSKLLTCTSWIRSVHAHRSGLSPATGLAAGAPSSACSSGSSNKMGKSHACQHRTSGPRVF